MTAIDYATYITSAAWQARRLRFIATTNGRCVCGETDDLHVHHATYDNLGCENDEELRLVCQRCHSEIHYIHRQLGGSLENVTDRVLRVIEAARKDHDASQAEKTRNAGKQLPWETPRHRRNKRKSKPAPAVELQPGEEWRLIEGKGWRRWRPITT